jgi:hypothetical protein
MPCSCQGLPQPRTFFVDPSGVREVTGLVVGNDGGSLVWQDTGTGSGLDMSKAWPIVIVAGVSAAIRALTGGSWVWSAAGGVALTIFMSLAFGCRMCPDPATGTLQCGKWKGC